MAYTRLFQVTQSHFGMQMRDTSSDRFGHFREGVERAGILNKPVLEAAERGQRKDEQVFDVIGESAASVGACKRFYWYKYPKCIVIYINKCNYILILIVFCLI